MVGKSARSAGQAVDTNKVEQNAEAGSSGVPNNEEMNGANVAWKHTYFPQQ